MTPPTIVCRCEWDGAVLEQRTAMFESTGPDELAFLIERTDERLWDGLMREYRRGLIPGDVLTETWDARTWEVVRLP